MYRAYLWNFFNDVHLSKKKKKRKRKGHEYIPLTIEQKIKKKEYILLTIQSKACREPSLLKEVRSREEWAQTSKILILSTWPIGKAGVKE